MPNSVVTRTVEDVFSSFPMRPDTCICVFSTILLTFATFSGYRIFEKRAFPSTGKKLLLLCPADTSIAVINFYTLKARRNKINPAVTVTQIEIDFIGYFVKPIIGIGTRARKINKRSNFIGVILGVRNQRTTFVSISLEYL